MKKLLLLPLLLTVAGASAQRGGSPDLHDSRADVRQKLQQYVAQHKLAAELSENDTALLLRVPAEPGSTVLFSYYFDGAARLRAYRYSECTPCVEKYLAGLLANTRYDWRPVNDTLYRAKGDGRLLRVARDGADLSITVIESAHAPRQ